MIHLTVCGSFGFGNAGDEAVPLALEDMARSMGEAIDIDLVGRWRRSSGASVGCFEDLEPRMLQKIRTQPCILTGGGVVDHRPISVLFRCASLMKEVGWSRTALFSVNAEAGVRYGWWTSRRIRKILARIPRVTARDPISGGILSRLADGREVPVLGDVILWMKAAPRPPEGLGEGRPYAAVNLPPRWSGRPSWRNWIADQLERLAQSLNVRLVFVPMSCAHDDDRAEHRAVAGILRDRNRGVETLCLEDPLPPRSVAAVFQQARLVVGMRLHACVMAYAQEVPFVGIAYHPKIRGFAQAVGREDCLIPSRPGKAQDEGAYGFDWNETEVSGDDLAEFGRRALEGSSFDRLPELKRRLLDEFAAIVGS